MRRIFRLDGTGSGLAQGPLETKVMAAIWARGGWVAVSDIHEACQEAKRELSYSTIKTIMSNLAEKGHLRKRSAGRANEFEAAQTREAFEDSVVGDILGPLMRDYRNPLLAHIVDQLDGEGAVVELERLIAEKKEKHRHG